MGNGSIDKLHGLAIAIKKGEGMVDDLEPLDSMLWFRRIELIANGELGCIESSLRHASHLLQLAPLSLRPQVALSIDEESFEALLSAGDFDTAARYLVAQPTALSIEGPGVDLVKATIRCSILNRTIHGIGKTVAQAVLDAWATCLLCVRTEYGSDLSGLTKRPEEQSEQRRHLSSC
jgi:hypothetical protein